MPCYDPGVQIGEVKAPYCVIHDGGIKTQDNTGGKLGQQIWEIVVLVPIADQPSLRAKCRQIKQALAAIRGLKDTGEDAPTGGGKPRSDGFDAVRRRVLDSLDRSMNRAVSPAIA